MKLDNTITKSNDPAVGETTGPEPLLKPKGDNPVETDIFNWIRRILMIASAIIKPTSANVDIVTGR
jgi:hypothetical protein